jgi:hypothetical protein
LTGYGTIGTYVPKVHSGVHTFMSTYDLSGSGVQALTGGTTRLFLAVTAFPPGVTTGRALPLNYYDVGLLRIGVTGFVGPAFSVDAESMFVDLPSGADSLGYALFAGATVTVREGLPPPPPGAFLLSNIDGTTVADGTSITVTWGGLEGQSTPKDWLGIFDSGHPVAQDDTSIFGLQAWIYLDDCSGADGGLVATPSGSCTANLTLGTNAPGSYDVYIMSNDSTTILVQDGVGFNVT